MQGLFLRLFFGAVSEAKHNSQNKEERRTCEEPNRNGMQQNQARVEGAEQHQPSDRIGQFPAFFSTESKEFKHIPDRVNAQSNLQQQPTIRPVIYIKEDANYEAAKREEMQKGQLAILPLGLFWKI